VISAGEKGLPTMSADELHVLEELILDIVKGVRVAWRLSNPGDLGLCFKVIFILRTFGVEYWVRCNIPGA